MASSDDGDTIELDSAGPSRRESDLPLSLQIENTDAVIINAPNDFQPADHFRNRLLKIDLTLDHQKFKPKVKLVSEIPTSSEQDVMNIKRAFRRTNYVFLFATRSLFEENSILSKLSTFLTHLRQDEEKAIIPVNTKNKRYRDYNLGLYDGVQAIELWSQDDIFVKSVQKLFESKIGERVRRDKLLEQKRAKYFEELASPHSSQSTLPEQLSSIALQGCSASPDPNQVTPSSGVQPHQTQREQVVTESASSIQIDGATSSGGHFHHSSQGQSRMHPPPRSEGMMHQFGLSDIPQGTLHQNHPTKPSAQGQREQVVTASASNVQIDGPTSSGGHFHHSSQGQSMSLHPPPRSEGMMHQFGLSDIPQGTLHQNHPTKPSVQGQREQVVTASASNVQIDGPTSSGGHFHHSSQGQSMSMHSPPRSEGMMHQFGLSDIPQGTLHQSDPTKLNAQGGYPMFALIPTQVFHPVSQTSSMNTSMSVQAPASNFVSHGQNQLYAPGPSESSMPLYSFYPQYVLAPPYHQSMLPPQLSQMIHTSEPSTYQQAYSESCMPPSQESSQNSTSTNRSMYQRSKANEQNSSSARHSSVPSSSQSSNSQAGILNFTVNIHTADQVVIGPKGKLINASERSDDPRDSDSYSDGSSSSSESCISQQTTEPSSKSERAPENSSLFKRSAGGSMSSGNGGVLSSPVRQPEATQESSQTSDIRRPHPNPNTEGTHGQFCPPENESQMDNSIERSQQTQVKTVYASDDDDDPRHFHQTQVKRVA